jgi:YegS/Rv2252/BmrU family lipid kinase
VLVTQVAMIVNPVKVDDAEALDAAVSRRLLARGWPAPTIMWTTVDDPGRGLAERAVADGAQVVLAAGGDGTVAAVVSGLAGSGVALAVVPSGTGNLLARNLDLPMDLDEVIDAVVDGVDVTIDVGEVVEGPGAGSSFAVMAGLGFDAAIVADAPDRLKAAVGWPAYLVAALSHLTDDPFECTITVDDAEPLVRRARTVLVANVATLQGGVDLAPSAGVSDGLLDVVVISPQGAVDWLRLGARIVRGSDKEDELLERMQGRRVEIRTSVDEVCQLDGDPVGPTQGFTAEIRPAALTLRMPRSPDR